ncbi:cytochrome c family protein [Sulfitobacter sp. 20_GPM-1509m]|uniref:c-type cytochrome n=1 Tax=Sulfitobacter sp. 20_GPM-1509m TaxID=1380367 RepID=UPI000490BAC4|nr:cytochrome c family protein [Sulfitobacter sp. 20_GPM-1509m]|tara:strand:- start:184 stop:687 length:504 start_codon:yes stop_codon:yes gene_type:complete
MFDTMTTTKVAGALCGALLIFLLGKWAAEGLYDPASHGEAAYVIEVADAGGDAAPAEEVNFDELMANADVESGAKVFRKCSACHKLDDTNGTGPHLDGLVGRDVGSVPGFSYSAAMAGHGGVWTPEEISHFIENPRGYISGTAMGFAGLKKPQDRADVIAYIQSVSN